jgi:hypothetical protein
MSFQIKGADRECIGQWSIRRKFSQLMPGLNRLSAFGIQTDSLLTGENLSRDEQHFTRRFAAFLRAEPSASFALRHDRFCCYRVAIQCVDVTLAEFSQLRIPTLCLATARENMEEWAQAPLLRSKQLPTTVQAYTEGKIHLKSQQRLQRMDYVTRHHLSSPAPHLLGALLVPLWEPDS